MPNPVLGIDLGGTKVLAAVIDRDGKVLGRAKGRTQKLKAGEDVFGRLIEAAREAVAKSGVPLAKIAAAGVGSPGPLDPETGVIEFTPNLGFHNFPLRDRVRETLGLPVFVNNDVTIGTFGEWKRGAAVGVRDLVGIFVGTGIGGGLVLDGRLYEGFNRMAGEIGHMVVELRGELCGCGNRGCLESIASRTAISRAILQAVSEGEATVAEDKFKGEPPTVRSKALADAYAAGDKVVRRVLNRAARALGVAAGSPINLLNPEMIVLSGGVIEALGEPYIDRIRKHAANWAFEVNMRGVRIVASALGDDAGIQGAAEYARMMLARNSR